MQATDALLYNREAICGIAAKHDLTASFLPKLSSTAAGNGAHLHLSIMKACGHFRENSAFLAPASFIAHALFLIKLVQNLLAMYEIGTWAILSNAISQQTRAI